MEATYVCGWGQGLHALEFLAQGTDGSLGLSSANHLIGGESCSVWAGRSSHCQLGELNKFRSVAGSVLYLSRQDVVDWLVSSFNVTLGLGSVSCSPGMGDAEGVIQFLDDVIQEFGASI